MPSPPGADKKARLTHGEQIIAACQRCELHETRTQTVPGEGSHLARIMFIGEAPGENEDKEGRPFIGKAGLILEEMLTRIGIDRKDVFITNTLKCRPPGNDNPTPIQTETCKPFLAAQIDIIDPELIIPMGAFALNYFIPDVKISQAQGKIHQIKIAGKPRILYPLFHPAYAGRGRGNYERTFESFLRIPGILYGLHEDPEQP